MSTSDPRRHGPRRWGGRAARRCSLPPGDAADRPCRAADQPGAPPDPSACELVRARASGSGPVPLAPRNALLRATRAAGLVRSTAPRVVALTSACSHRMTPNYHVAGIAKAALEATVLYLAMQLGRDGVLVNAVSTRWCTVPALAWLPSSQFASHRWRACPPARARGAANSP